MTPVSDWDLESNFTGKKILVTGGAGFIGSHIADALATDADVWILDNLSSGRHEHVPEQASLIEGDVRDESTVERAMDEVEIVFHQAAIVSIDESIAAPIESHSVNVDGTLQLLKHARRQDARVVAASSAAIYGEPGTNPITESEPIDPLSPYGLDKFAVDRYTRLYHELYGLPTVVLRPFNAYGPRQGESAYAGVISTFLDQARSGGPITVEGEGDQTRDFVHVRDLVQAYLRAAITDAVGEAFNIGTGTSVSIRKLAEIVRNATDTPAEIIHTDPRPGDITHSRADISKAQSLLDYESTIGLTDGIHALAR